MRICTNRAIPDISRARSVCQPTTLLRQFLASTALLAALALGWSWGADQPAWAEEREGEPNKATWIGWSPITIAAPGLAFGGEAFSDAGPRTTGHLDWHLIDGQLVPSLTGYLHLSGTRNLCARTRIDYFVGGQLWTTKYGAQLCAPDDQHHVWPIALADYRSDKIDAVRVSIERLTGMKQWILVGSERRALTMRRDRVRIADGGFVFGGTARTPKDAARDGEVLWVWRGAQVRPRITGTLRIDKAAAGCARLRVAYFQPNGTRLAEKTGTTMCAPEQGSASWPIDLDPFSDNKLTSITIELQTLGEHDTWRTIGTASIDYVVRTPAQCADATDCLHTTSYEIK